MSLAAGTRLGPYEVLSLVGAGGMGEVYKAKDTRLDRTVAIKILPPQLASDPQFRERFDREARTISQLDHPHICALYDVGDQDGTAFLVMQYLEGETLAERLTKGALPVDQALRIAIDVADALDKAHRAGIVHRDLKPGNIFLTKSGARLLDFGLAKPSRTVIAGAGLSVLPTTPPHLTAQGTILGTFQYMAPEQLECKETDARTDIFAFGAVLYEMVTNRKAFEGSSTASLIAAILERDPPPVSTLQPMTPPALDHVVNTCLAKDPDERWQTAGDIKRELKWIAGSASQVALQAVTTPVGIGRRGLRKARAAAMGIVVALVILGGYRLLKRAPSGPLVRLGRTAQITFDPGLNLDPTLSPDGKLVAYAAGPMGQTHIYVRQLGAAHSIALTEGLPGYHRWPQWSPDGSRIVFFSVNRRAGVTTISSIPSLGGAAKRLIEEKTANLDERSGNFFCCPSWSPDGARIAYASGNAVYVLPLAGGRPAKITEHPFPAHSPTWSPDGARIAYVVENPAFVFGVPQLGNVAPSALWVVPATGGRAVQVAGDRVHLNMSPTWTPDSKHLLFISNRGGRRDLYEVALPDSSEPSGPPALLTAGLNALTINLSADGARLAYTVLSHEANIWSIPIPGRPPISISAATPVTTGNQAIEGIGISPDGRWLAFDSNRSGNQDIYRMPLDGGEIEQLTTSPGDDFTPAWSPDGKEIAFFSWRNGTRDLFLMAAEGGSERQLTSDPGHEWYPDWSPDGKHIAFRSIQQGKDTLALLTRTADGAGWEGPRDLVAPGGWPRWSPDGRLVAYVALGRSLRVISPQSGAPRVLVESQDPSVVPAPGFAAWSRDSRTVYYKAYDAEGRSSFWAVPAVGGTPTLLVKFDDPARQSHRIEFATNGERFFFTIAHYQSDIFVMDVEKER